MNGCHRPTQAIAPANIISGISSQPCFIKYINVFPARKTNITVISQHEIRARDRSKSRHVAFTKTH